MRGVQGGAGTPHFSALVLSRSSAEGARAPTPVASAALRDKGPGPCEDSKTGVVLELVLQVDSPGGGWGKEG